MPLMAGIPSPIQHQGFAASADHLAHGSYALFTGHCLNSDTVENKHRAKQDFKLLFFSRQSLEVLMHNLTKRNWSEADLPLDRQVVCVNRRAVSRLEKQLQKNLF